MVAFSLICSNLQELFVNPRTQFYIGTCPGCSHGLCDSLGLVATPTVCSAVEHCTGAKSDSTLLMGVIRFWHGVRLQKPLSLQCPEGSADPEW